MEKLKTLFRSCKTDSIIIRLLSSLCWSSLILSVYAGADFTDIELYANISLTLAVAVFIFIFAIQTIITIVIKSEKTDRILLIPSFSVYALYTIMVAGNYYYTFGMVILAAVLIFYYSEKGYFNFREITRKQLIRGVIIAAVVFTVLLSLYGVFRYLNYQTPNYDFGIFCQMFYNLRRCFQPLTTVERDTLLSHFSVHMSLIYYIVLPVYAIFPSPVTIQLMQAFALGSAAIPVYLLAKKAGLENIKILAVVVAVMLHPALFGGSGYDFHENCFLVPLLLWMFYFFEKENYIVMAVFALLTCMVKEDAPVYIIFFALWMFIARGKKKPAVLLGIGAMVYFVGVIAIMTKYGNGIMSNRYSNFLSNENGGLFEVVKNIFANPGYVFTQIFADKDGGFADKLLLLLQLTVPFAFIPFCIKKVSNLILLMPMLLINFMSVYVYQYNIGYQYVYGPFVFLVYIFIINLKDLKTEKAVRLLFTGAVASLMLLSTIYIPKTVRVLQNYKKNYADIQIMNDYLEEIPDDSSIICSTMLIPKLSKRQVLYEDYYHKPAEGEIVDYVIADMRYSKEEFIEKYEGLGYEVTDTIKSDNGRVLLVVLTYPD